MLPFGDVTNIFSEMSRASPIDIGKVRISWRMYTKKQTFQIEEIEYLKTP